MLGDIGAIMLIYVESYLGAAIMYVFGSPVGRFAFALLGTMLLIGNQIISEYLRDHHHYGVITVSRPGATTTIVNGKGPPAAAIEH
jgi:hypothetical protein